MSKSSKYRFGTKAIHSGVEPDSATGAIMTPIYQTSTYVQSAPGEHKGYEYSRSQNPTREALEKSIAALENADFGHCFASGLAAIDAIIKTLKPGDEVISTNDLYGGTYRIFTKIFQDFGIHFHFVNMSNAADVEKHITEKTKLIWVETPTNPMMNIIDIRAIADIAKKHAVTLAVDNTFSTPYLQNPLDLGADLVMHSVTKYIAGHSDVVMGALATSNKELSEKLTFIQNASGAVPGPQDCFLVLRGIKTLHLRMQRHCENGAGIANFLKSHPKVDKVFWPGFKSHPNHEIACKQMHDFGGMISFSLKENTKSAATEILKKFKLFTLAESLGGVESLSGHPATMTHASIPKAERDKVGLSDSLIRLSVGVEDIEDLIQDLKQALS
ncbi:cystathionine beta-lyase [Marivirga tractuosa]|uniref:Cystathionine gamma-lyase n=1 Tax=Marivirga tractuosa (strain ATCC 23168 / DSM 4126 / NBRC 15989 / NCIMB 1408 / VKM B-1430 / H-43) TaxID=643867 RepID=E4TR73_MARTH|nr:cystathionine gamma-synthase [Marivirga tractuosa]ADR23725.1 cystathionine gamma-lyase [Marivirga tractuosa DSM 4126]BDD15594.1 cystathionine beta-lyase [Marivirga tractuosa]